MRAETDFGNRLGLVFNGGGLFAAGATGAQPADMKFEAILVWGTDDTKPPEGKDYKPVTPEVRKKLKDLPLKWANWFEVNRIIFTVPQGATKEVPMSEKCQLKVKNWRRPTGGLPHWQGQRSHETQAGISQRRDAGPGRQRPQLHLLAGRPEAHRVKLLERRSPTRRGLRGPTPGRRPCLRCPIFQPIRALTP